jgi:hypothetical protein
MEESTEAAALPGPKLLDGFLTREQLETEFGWKWRTTLRREAQGLPVVRIGNLKLYPVDRVRAWLLAQLPQREPRRRGRPRRAA